MRMAFIASPLLVWRFGRKSLRRLLEALAPAVSAGWCALLTLRRHSAPECQAARRHHNRARRLVVAASRRPPILSPGMNTPARAPLRPGRRGLVLVELAGYPTR